MIRVLIGKIRVRIDLILGKYSISTEHPQRITNYKKYLNRKPKGTVLLTYLVHPLILDSSGIKKLQFSNYGLAVSIARVLNRIGYIVDIVNWDDLEFKPEKEYDLYFLHGGKTFKNIEPYIGTKSKVIYFSTGSYWKFHNKAEDSRIEYFKKRHGISLPRDRYIYDSEEDANKRADAIICIGNKSSRDTYHKFDNVFNIEIGSRLPKKKIIHDNFEDKKRHFLFFSGGGNIHKGLDLALEAFDKTNLQLHICTHLDPEFKSSNKELLFNRGNIHYEGFLSPGSDKFMELAEKCGFVILPSCSEGNPGSVVDCMHYGLVPVVTEAAHIDVDLFGIKIPDDTVEGVRKTAIDASKMKPEELKNRSELAKSIARERHTVKMFESKLENIISKVVG